MIITTKKLIACWVGLGIIAAVSVKVFDTARDEVTQTESARVPYVELSDAQLIQMEYRECLGDRTRRAQLAAYGSSCEQSYSNVSRDMIDAARLSYRAGVALKITQLAAPEIRKIDSMQEKFFYVVAFAAVVVSFLWFKSVLLPRLIAVKDVVKERTPSASDLKALGANRRVRQAESDFHTLKNLHDNGLINDEMFEKRKAELKEALSANKVFQD